VKNNKEDINQFEEMPLFSNPMNIKHIEKYFDKKLMPYMRKGGNEKFVRKLCIIFHINIGICLYGFEFVSYNIIWYFSQNSSKKIENIIQMKLKMKFKHN
jgi:hypothetical protein